ncbi:MAG: hypothetical protein LQ342_007659 [Letrouitia transgressa]|nr:MAG: hypothetical protein LQ342_007659 [Letrouitia transgressa]
MYPSSNIFHTTTIYQHMHFGHSATVQPGCVYFLPIIDDLTLAENGCRSIDRRILDHPVLVLSIDPWRDTATVLIISSLGGKDLGLYSLNFNVRRNHIPIFPNEPHPDNGSIVYLDTDWGLPKQSYIKTSHRYELPQSLLRPFFDQQTGQQFRLKRESLDLVKEFTNQWVGHRRRSSSPLQHPIMSAICPAWRSTTALSAFPRKKIVYTVDELKSLSKQAVTTSVAIAAASLVAGLLTRQV